MRSVKCLRTTWLASCVALLVAGIGTAQAAGSMMFATSPASTGEKPQSKLWYHDGSWWGILDGPSGVAFYEKVGGSWVRGTFTGAVLQSAGQADVKWTGSRLLVLVYTLTPYLYEFTYNASQRTWVPVSGFPVALPNPNGSETMVLEQDSSGRLWTAAEGDGNINVYYSTSADHRTWTSTPVVLQSGVNADDICSIVAFGGNKIGVFWSDQDRDQFGFRYHDDADAPTSWSAIEIADSGSGHADDHINLAYDSQGRVYAISKDDQNRMRLHRRSTSGSWTTKTDVTGHDCTRGIVMVCDQDSKVFILYTNWSVVPETIDYRVADMSSLTFGSATTFISDSANMNNVSGTKQVLGTGNLVAVAENGTECWYNSFGSPPGGGSEPSPPAPPSNLVASIAANGASVNLSWTASPSGPDGYNVYRSIDSGPASKLNGPLVTGTSYTDAAPVSGQLCYEVRAQKSGLESISSNSACVAYEPPPPPPGPPQNHTASLQGTSPQSALLGWDLPASGTPVGYNVYRSVDTSPAVKLNGALVPTRSFVDANLTYGVSCYEITAVDAYGQEGTRSAAACVTWLPAPPVAPSGVTVAASMVAGAAGGIAAWECDEGAGQTLTDACGNGHGGQLGSASGSDSGDPAWTTGPNDGALLFDGSNDRVTVADAADLRIAGSLTVEAWLQRSSTGSADCILNKGDSNFRNYCLLIDSSGRIDFRWETQGGANHGTLSAAVLGDTGWHHVACVYDQQAGENRIYLDGILVKSASDSGTPVVSADPLYIGARESSGSLRDWFGGRIDLVRVSAGAVYGANFTPPIGYGGPALGRFELVWAAPPGGYLGGYNVYRRVDAWPGARLNDALVPSLAYADVAPPSGALAYWVTAVDLWGRESDPSPVTCTPSLYFDPLGPGGLRAADDAPAAGVDPGAAGLDIAAGLHLEAVPGARALRVHWAISRPGPLRLDVYDVRGRRVERLASGEHAAGERVLSWPRSGARAPAAGVYFFVLESGTTHLRAKAILHP